MTRTPSPPLRNIRKLSFQKQKTVLPVSKKVKVTTTLFVMGDHTDYGQLLRPELNTNYMWDCDLAAGTYQTPCSGIHGGESYLKSALSYSATGFTMDLTYDFIRGDDGNGRVYGDDYGYVQGTRKPGDTKDPIPPKLSFVANGGIKFGSTKGYGDGVFEVALLDVRAMVHHVLQKSMQEEITDQEFEQIAFAITHPIETNKNGEVIKEIQINGINYAHEELACLLNAVGYGQYYSYMSSYYHVNNNDEFDYAYCLKQAYLMGGQSNRLQISARKAYSQVIVSQFLNQSETAVIFEGGFFKEKDDSNVIFPPIESVPINAGDGHLYLQSHWGSGVRYTVSSIVPEEPKGGV